MPSSAPEEPTTVGRTRPYDPRQSWLPAVAVFLLALALVVDDALPGGVVDGGLWIPVLYAIVPVAVGLLAFVRTRTASGRRIRPAILLGATVWGVVGGLAVLVGVIVVGLGRPPTAPGSPSSTLAKGLFTFLVPSGAFAGCYGEAGRRARRSAALLVAIAPVSAAAVLVPLVYFAP